MYDINSKDTPRRRDERDFADGEGESGEELLGELGRMKLDVYSGKDAIKIDGIR